MRSLIAMALLGVGAVLFSATAPAQAMTAGSAAGVAKIAATADSSVHEVRRRWKHRHYRRWHHRHYYGPRFYRPYRPYYYGGYYPYYYPRYYRRPGIRLYFGF